jgi:hypothetical protein
VKTRRSNLRKWRAYERFNGCTKPTRAATSYKFRVQVGCSPGELHSRKRGGHPEVARYSTADFDRAPIIEARRASEICVVDDALQRLAQIDERRHE